ncbi:MAG: FTR1 family protein [Proteobacteria bacterium]|nr:FTR1 family protein [Pseudomonadota bacterium]MBI3497871.1 FTR1 family protein [Pseudomonadota bacterium]
MFASALIVCREVMEAALVIGIVMASTRGLALRGRFVAAGVAGGLGVAVLLAFFAGQLSASFAGVGQELFNASVLFAAVVMLAWHNIWMSRHGKEIAQRLSLVGRDVAAGRRSLAALAIIVGLAVMREGSEVVLFLFGVAAAEGGQAMPIVLGSAIGVLAGAAIGFALFFGLTRVPQRLFFRVTTWLIAFLAAGMAAQGAQFLVAADLLPALGDAVWDSSALLSEDSLAGRFLHGLIGYTAQPSGIQLAFYAVTLVALAWFTRQASAKPVNSGKA